MHHLISICVQVRSVVACLAIIVITSAGSAGTRDQGGGGHRLGLNAAATLKRLPEILKSVAPDLVSPQQLKDFEALAQSESTLVMIVPRPLKSKAAGFEQNGTAYSVAGGRFRVISIYDQDWKDMKGDPAEELAFMAHEAAVLMGLESTGAYGRLSAELKNRLRNAPAVLAAPAKTKWACFGFCRVVSLVELGEATGCVGPTALSSTKQLSSEASTRLGAYEKLVKQCKARVLMCNKGQLFETEQGARSVRLSEVGNPENVCFPN